MTSEELEWFENEVPHGLNQALADAASRHGWNLVDGIFEDSATKGYCDVDGRTTRLNQSFAVQGDILGAYHPNEDGQANCAQRIAERLNANLYVNEDLAQLRQPKLNIQLAPLLFYQYILDVRVVGSGSDTVRATAAGIDCGTVCGGLYNQDALINLGFSPASDSTFVGWLGDCTGLGGCILTMDDDKLVSAIFQLKEVFLPTEVSGNGKGRVLSFLAGIDCNDDCTGSFLSGTTVTLAANPDPGSDFFGWMEACSGTGPCTSDLNFTQSLEAIFTGSNRVVPTDFSSGRQPVTVLFNQVDEPGFTWMLIFPVGQITLPDGYDLGELRELVQLGILAEFTGPATVCLEYEGTTFNNSSFLRLFHNMGGADWIDTTSFNYALGNVTCGSVDALPAASTSVFGVFEAVGEVDTAVNQITGIAPGTAVDSSSSNVEANSLAADVVGLSSSSAVVGVDDIVVEVLVNDSTQIHEPPDINVGLAAVEFDDRVVVTLDQNFRDNSGSLNDLVFTSGSIVIVPQQVTRQHQRAVVKGSESGGVTVVDKDGSQTFLPGSGGAEFSKGDGLVLMVQHTGLGGAVAKIKSVVPPNAVDQRLARLAGTTVDPIKGARLKILQNGRDAAEE